METSGHARTDSNASSISVQLASERSQLRLDTSFSEMDNSPGNSPHPTSAQSSQYGQGGKKLESVIRNRRASRATSISSSPYSHRSAEVHDAHADFINPYNLSQPLDATAWMQHRRGSESSNGWSTSSDYDSLIDDNLSASLMIDPAYPAFDAGFPHFPSALPNPSYAYASPMSRQNSTASDDSFHSPSKMQPQTTSFGLQLAQRDPSGKLVFPPGSLMLNPPPFNAALEEIVDRARKSGSAAAQDKARTGFCAAWLTSCFVLANEGNISRTGFYGAYAYTCEEYGIRPVNSASFGKAVRQAYPNIKTRRLGVRGQSRYHYCGIRPTTSRMAELLIHCGDTPDQNHIHQASSHMMLRAESESAFHSNAFSDRDSPIEQSAESIKLKRQLSAPIIKSPMALDFGLDPKTPTAFTYTTEKLGAPPPTNSLLGRPSNLRRHTSNLPSGDLAARATRKSSSLSPQNEAMINCASIFPNFASSQEIALAASADTDQQAVDSLWRRYESMSVRIVECFREGKFEQYETIIRSFWDGCTDFERSIMQQPSVAAIFFRTDAQVYSAMLDILSSQYMHTLPPDQFVNLKQLASNLETITVNCLTPSHNPATVSPTFVGPRVELSARVGHLISRHLGICQLSEALGTIMSNHEILKGMLTAWSQVDFGAIRNQAALMTNCSSETLEHVFNMFRSYVESPLGQMAASFSATVNLIQFANNAFDMAVHTASHALHHEGRVANSRNVLIKWNYVAGQVMRDFTLQSSSSFGSFQILNLFVEEWLSFRVLKEVALHAASVAAATSTEPPTPIYTSVSPTVGLLHPDTPYSSVPSFGYSPKESLHLASHLAGLTFTPSYSSTFSPNTQASFNEMTMPGASSAQYINIPPNLGQHSQPYSTNLHPQSTSNQGSDTDTTPHIPTSETLMSAPYSNGFVDNNDQYINIHPDHGPLY